MSCAAYHGCVHTRSTGVNRMARVAETHILGTQDAMYHHTTYARHETLVSGDARSKAIAYNSELRVSSLFNLHCIILRNQWQDPFLEDITMRCVCVSSGVPSMVAAVFHNLPTCAHEILRRGSSSAHRIMLRNILSRINKADLLYSINRRVKDMHTYTLPSHILHHAGNNNNANKSYPT